MIRILKNDAPPDSKFKLTKRDIAILTKWIDQGAQWKPHWAFMSPLAPNLDKLKKGQNEIDYFIDKS
ncbi:MAG: hypothetical protein IPG82_11340 [Saprospiraceae bacterium]|nr:hypothetical protein [Saprospiraceae bacterium]